MSLPIDESPIINEDIENDVTSSHRTLVQSEAGKFRTMKLHFPF